MPKLIHFNSYTKFREAMSFLGFSEEDDSVQVKLSTDTDRDGLVHLTMTTSRGLTARTDATLKSEGLDSDAYVNLHDLCVMCDKGVKENDCALWVDDGRLYIGSCFNDSFGGFESECSIPMTTTGFTGFDGFDKTTSVTIEQSTLAGISDSCYNFKYVELWRIDGIVSFRTGDDRVSIATITNGADCSPQIVDESLPDLAIRIPVNVFKVIGMTNDSTAVCIEIDADHGYLHVGGDTFDIMYHYQPGQFASDDTDGLTDYMKFDAISMMATVDMIYGINYLDPIAPVKLTPINESTVAIELTNTERYSATLTMCGVRMYDTEKSIVLPMDVASMMIRNCNCSTLVLKIGENGRLFMCYQNKHFARKCMYFGD